MSSDFNITNLNTFYNALTNINTSLETTINQHDPIEPLLDQLQSIIQSYGALSDGKKDTQIEEKSKQILQNLKSIEKTSTEPIKIKIQQSIDKIETLRSHNFKVFNNMPWPQEINVLGLSHLDLKALLSVSSVSQEFKQAAEEVIISKINDDKIPIKQLFEDVNQVQRDDILKKIGSRITHLDCSGLERGEVLKLTSFCPNLSTLLLVGCKINKEEATALANSPNLKQLRVLDLSHNSLGPAGVKTLADSPNLKQVRVLNLKDNFIGNEGVKTLADSSNLENLETLNLSNNWIESEGVMALAKSSNLPQVRVLDLSGNIYGRKGEQALADFLISRGKV